MKIDLHMRTVATLTSLNNVPLSTSVDTVPLMKTAGVVENSGHCIHSIRLVSLNLHFAALFIDLYIHI